MANKQPSQQYTIPEPVGESLSLCTKFGKLVGYNLMGEMGKKESVPNRPYTEEFKTEAVRLALSTGGNAAAKRLGIPQSTMTNWVRQTREGSSTPVEGAAAPASGFEPGGRECATAP